MVIEYIIDSSSFIELKEHNPLDLYPSVWDRLITLHSENRLCSHVEVYDEIERKDDELKEWSKKQKNSYPKLFENYTTQQQRYPVDILNNFGSFVKVNKATPTDADPWLIALALELKIQIRFDSEFGPVGVEPVIVTEEVLKSNQIKIPYVCNHYGIKCLNIFDMFRQEGWTF